MSEKPEGKTARISARIEELSKSIGGHVTLLERTINKTERLEIWALLRGEMTEWREIHASERALSISN